MALRAARIKDIVGALAFIVVSGVFASQLKEVPPAAAKYPMILIYVICGFCLILLAQSVMEIMRPKPVAAAEQPPAGGESANPTAPGATEPQKCGLPTLKVVVISFLYVLALPYIGFTIASAIMLVVFMYSMGMRSLLALILVPLCEIAFLLYVFESLLAVYLPNAAVLKEWLGLLK